MSPRKLSNEAVLKRLGVDNPGSIFEVIVSTCDAQGAPNAAPMGIRFQRAQEKTGENEISIRPFKSTTTHRNLSSQREGVINITCDPLLFYETAFKQQSSQSKLKSFFCTAETVKPPRIKECDAYIEVSVRYIADANGEEKDRSEMLCKVKSVQLAKPEARLYSRAPHLLIEAIIHATRIRELESQGLADEANELARLIDRYVKLIHRVAPSSQYEHLAEKLAAVAGAGGEAKRSRVKEEGDA